MEEKKEISLEEIMDRLDDTVTQMENDKMTLEESYQAFSGRNETCENGK